MHAARLLSSSQIDGTYHARIAIQAVAEHIGTIRWIYFKKKLMQEIFLLNPIQSYEVKRYVGKNMKQHLGGYFWLYLV